MNEENKIHMNAAVNNNLNQEAGSMSVVTAVTDLTNADKGSGSDISTNNTNKINSNL